MTFLCSPIWNNGAGYNVERQYMKWLALEWLPGCVVSDSNPYVVRENVFGGYEVHIRFPASFEAFTGGGWRNDSIFADYYATAPGSSVPINAGSVQFAVVSAPNVEGNVIAINQGGSTGRIWVFRLPVTPASVWYALPPDNLPDVFCIQQPFPSVFLPAPAC